jgi:hypothetical protein
MKLDQEFECRTVGQLKKLLENVPDEWVLVTPNEDCHATNITHINSFWHGALTFEQEK